MENNKEATGKGNGKAIPRKSVMDDLATDIQFTKEQEAYINKICVRIKRVPIDFSKLTDNDIFDIIDFIGDRVISLIDDDMLRPYPPEVTMCYSILDYLGEH
jgi:hypothetical protein